MARKHADYEYKLENGKIRIEKVHDDGNKQIGWMWRYFGDKGLYQASNELGELYRTKRDAKQAGIKHSVFLEHKHTS